MQASGIIRDIAYSYPLGSNSSIFKIDMYAIFTCSIEITDAKFCGLKNNIEEFEPISKTKNGYKKPV